MTKIKGACKIGDFSKVLKENLLIYTTEVTESLGEMSQDLARSSAKDINKAAKSTFKGTGSTGYAKGWRAKNMSVRHRSRWVIHNANAPGLAHLLEKGHAIANGKGRTTGRIHIKPIEEKMIEEYEANVIKIIKNGG